MHWELGMSRHLYCRLESELKLETSSRKLSAKL